MIADLHIEETFIKDYGNAPDHVQKRVDYLVNYMAVQGNFPNSFNPHKAETGYVWIGYITRSRQHWRVLYEVDEYTSELYLLRIVTHKEMDKILSEYAKV